MTRPPAQLYVLYRYPQLSQTFVTNEIHGMRRLGADVDVISVEDGDDDRVGAERAGASRSLQRPSVLRALRDHAWFALAHWPHYRSYVRAVASLRDHWRLALLRLPTEARRLLAQGPPDCCHTHFAWSTAAIAVYLARLLGVPVSITVHAKDIYTAAPRRLRSQLGHFDRVVTVCSYNVGFLAGLGATAADSGGVTVVPCGVDVPDESPAVCAEERIELLSVGRLVEKKGFDTLIRAIALLRPAFPDVRAVIVGEGPQHSALAALIAELGLERNVTLAGALSHEDTLHLISACELFCLASQPALDGDCDALPVVLREAMARATAVVSTRVAGIPETVDEQVGWLVDPRSPERLAGAITHALSDESERRTRGRAGRDRVLARWTIDRQLAGMLAVLPPRGARAPGRVRTPTGRPRPAQRAPKSA
jgi:glycosyltransferase involved in cell wall biosynthesis